MKTLLILADGMRPDAIREIPQVKEMMKKATYTMDATTVTPSVTLPCHMSLFHSVDPSRHGTTTNYYMPQVRPIDGLCEVLAKGKCKNAFFYDWSALRDLARPFGPLVFSFFRSGSDEGWAESSDMITEAAVTYLKARHTDFAFIYMGYPDEAGHSHGWMSEEYMESLRHCWDNIQKIVDALQEEYTIFVTADHGGHDRTHGTELPEDMTIPLFMLGQPFEAGKKITGVNIKDIAPTIAKLHGVEPAEEWEGKALV